MSRPRPAFGHGVEVDPSPSAIATTVHVHEDDERAREIGEQYWSKTSAMTTWHYDQLASDYFLPNATVERPEKVVATAYEDQASAGIVGQAQRAGQRAEQLGRGLAAAALLEAYDVVDGHAGERGHLFAAQAGGAVAPSAMPTSTGRIALRRRRRKSASWSRCMAPCSSHPASRSREWLSHDEPSVPQVLAGAQGG